MSAMTKHIGTEVDYPSMGACVGGREIGYLYGQVRPQINIILRVSYMWVTFSGIPFRGGGGGVPLWARESTD